MCVGVEKFTGSALPAVLLTSKKNNLFKLDCKIIIHEQ